MTSRPADLVLRVVGVVVAVAGAVATAVLCAFLTPLYVGTFRLPLAVLVAVLANVGLVWFTYVATGNKLAALLPGLVWMGLMIMFSATTTEGDIVLALNNWVVLATIVAGVAAYTLAGYRLLNPPRRDERHDLGPFRGYLD